MKDPWLKFFTGDHLHDSGVRSVSLAARGLWTDMLCLMHQSARKGYLQHPSGLSVTPEQLARMAGTSVDETTGLLQELEDSGVFSRTRDGVIYSRRMDRDARKSVACSAAGRRGGGNPHIKAPPLNVTFKGEPKGAVKGQSKVISHSEVRSQKSEVRDQKEETPSEAEASSGETADAAVALAKEPAAKNSAKKAAAKPVPEVLPDPPPELTEQPGFAEAWDQFGRMRERIRKRLTHYAAELILRTLVQRPGDAVAALELSVFNEWQGVEWSWLDQRRVQQTASQRNGTSRRPSTIDMSKPITQF